MIFALIKKHKKSILKQKIMTKNKVALNFIGYPPPQKIVFYRYIIIQMAKNTSFQLPDVSLIDLTTGVDAFESAYLNADEKDDQQPDLLESQEKAIDELFKIQALYIENIANGQQKIIFSSGFQPEQVDDLNKK